MYLDGVSGVPIERIDLFLYALTLCYLFSCTCNNDYLDKQEFIDTMQSSIIKLLDAKVHATNLLSAFGCKGLHILPHSNDT